MTRPSPSWVLWVIALGAAGVACSDHDARIERRGGPLPDYDATPAGNGGEGGTSSALGVRFCQAEVVLRTSCQRCHAQPTLNGAPFSLVTYADTQEVFSPATGKLRWQRMEEVVEQGIMPFRGTGIQPPVEALTCEERSTLLGWLGEGAKPEGGIDCSAGEHALLTCD